MAYADDLLSQAYHLAHLDADDPVQASLRRSVSTAYYALFHLLIDESVGNWGIARHRGVLARTFDHGKMKAICQYQVRTFYSTGSEPSGLQLKEVALTFCDLQDQRHVADYDNTFAWSRADAIGLIKLADDAIRDWRLIRESEAAQDFLLALFLPKTPRQ